jgi:hypothetical protein
MTYSLSDAEKETIVLWNYADDTATVDTHDRALIRKLRKNAVAVLIEEGLHGHTPWAKFEIPKGLISFRTGRRIVTDSQRAALARGRRAV